MAEVRREVDAVNERVAAVEERETADVVRGATRFNFGGYIKADTMVSRYKWRVGTGSEPESRFPGFPALIPVGGDTSTTDVDFHAKETRFNFGFAHDTDGGNEVSGLSSWIS